MNGFDLSCGVLIFLIIGCGLCGNVLSFIVWTKGRRCKKLPGGIHPRALAVSDTVALLIPAFNEAITLVSSLNTKEENNFLCRLEIFGRHYGLMMSSWIIVTFTIERTVAIFRPAGTSNLVSKNGTIALMTIIFVVSFIMNIPYGIVYEIKQVSVTKLPVPDTSYPLDLNQSEDITKLPVPDTSYPLDLNQSEDITKLPVPDTSYPLDLNQSEDIETNSTIPFKSESIIVGTKLSVKLTLRRFFTSSSGTKFSLWTSS